MPPERIFITGATGLVGSHIARYFYDQGYTNLAALKRSTSNTDLLAEIADKIDWVEGDVTEMEALEEGCANADWVIHSAALISNEKRDEDKLYEVNALGTANVVNAALSAGVSKLLYISSIATMPRTGRNEVITEKTPWQTTRHSSYYGYTKYLGEMEVWRGNAEGLETAMLNPSIILGSGFWKNGSLQIVNKLASGLAYYPVGSSGFVDVRDIARLALIRLRTASHPGRMLVNGWNGSYKRLFDLLSDSLGVKTPGIRVPPWLAEIAWRVLLPVHWITREQMSITRYTTRSTSAQVEFDNSLSLELDGFSYTPIEKTTKDIGERYREWAQNPSVALPLAF